MPTRRSLLLSSIPLGLATRGLQGAPAGPPLVLPSKHQVQWSAMEYYNFVHFTVNTFTDKEWGDGNEDPSIFNPTDFDADALVQTLKASGSAGVILTCKHHDGFCLWPTRTTDHSIRHSPYRQGKGDLVREMSEAAGRAGLRFGVYVSPWDRNQGAYGTAAYLDIYRQQIRELLTNYGPLFEIWHDGANGGLGYYGGANETRTIDKQHYYDWQNTWKLERQLQPNAVIFSDAGPDVRWVGNEKGVAGETCWATYTPHSATGSGPGVPGDIIEGEATTGDANGHFWMPAECDVSIRPGWFWHGAENDKVKTPDELLTLFYESAGRGASFLLNVPPDRRGRIFETDAAHLREFGQRRAAIFHDNLLKRARLSPRQASTEHPPAHVIDGLPDTYWSPADPSAPAELIAEWERPVTFRVLRVREAIALGQRVHRFSLECWRDGQWAALTDNTSIGSCRIVPLSKEMNTARVRLRILEAVGAPAISEFGLYAG